MGKKLVSMHSSPLPDNSRDSGPLAGQISQARFKVEEICSQKAPMRDGTRIALDLIRPQGEGRFPAILCQTPYGKETMAGRARWFAQRGYVVVNSDARGRFESEGDWDPFSPLHKSDGYDLVEWVAGQPWCTGRVGAYGESYLGWTQWWTATQAPPSLKCIVPEVSPPDHLFNCPYQNGLLVGWTMDWAALMAGRTMNTVGEGAYGGFADRREVEFRRLPYVDLVHRSGAGHAPWFETWFLQNTADADYWRAIAYQTPENWARVQAPSLAITGWFDANFPGTPANYLAMKRYAGTPEARRPRFVIGPWNHQTNTSTQVGDLDFGERSLIDWNGYVCRWFDFHLKQIENGILDDPPVHVFVMGRNQWRAASDWPLPETKWTKYYLHSGGRANGSGGDGMLSIEAPGDEPSDRFTDDPADPVPSPRYVNGHIDGPRDLSRTQARPDLLIYTTPPLMEEVEVVGPITARLFAATSARDTNWMIRLTDVSPDGKAMFLGEGVMRARHRDPQRGGAFNPRQLSIIEPDTVYSYIIEFWRPTANVFAKGHRIRIEVSSSFFPYYLCHPNTGADNIALETRSTAAQQTIHHDRHRDSHLVLPIMERR
jgi:putative CocE/NonD family hydrolase